MAKSSFTVDFNRRVGDLLFQLFPLYDTNILHYETIMSTLTIMNFQRLTQQIKEGLAALSTVAAMPTSKVFSASVASVLNANVNKQFSIKYEQIPTVKATVKRILK